MTAPWQQILDKATADGWAAVYDPTNPNTRTKVGDDIYIIADGLGNLSNLVAVSAGDRGVHTVGHFGDLDAIYKSVSASDGMWYVTASDHVDAAQPFAVLALLQSDITTGDGTSTINTAAAFSDGPTVDTSSSGYVGILGTNHWTFAATSLTGGGPIHTNPYVQVSWLEATSSKIYINGTSVVSGAAGSRDSAKRLTIGVHPGNTTDMGIPSPARCSTTSSPGSTASAGMPQP